MRFKHILTTISLLFAAFTGVASSLTGEWRVYPSFNDNIQQIVETPGKVYFTAMPQDYVAGYANNDDKYCSLFVYDKDSDELRAESVTGNLSRNMVLKIAYNPYGKYLVVVNDDLSIEMIYDNGEVHHISTLANATLPGKRGVNNISFDEERGDVFLSLPFGYVRIDSKNHQVAESHIYNTPLWDVARVGGRIVIATDDGIMAAFEKDARFNLDEYNLLPNTKNVRNLLPIDNDNFLVVYQADRNPIYDASIYDYKFVVNGLQAYASTRLDYGRIYDLQTAEGGWIYRIPTQLIKVGKDKNVEKHTFPSERFYHSFTSRDFATYWEAQAGLGLSKWDTSSSKWVCVKEPMLPNAPSPLNTYNTAYSDKYGVIVGNHGYEGRWNNTFAVKELLNVSGFKDGFWKDFSPRRYDSTLSKTGDGFVGMALDPVAPNYIYRGSLFNGLVRINLDDPSDILLFTKTTQDVDADWALKIFPVQNAWKALCGTKYPQFDADGNLLFIYGNHNEECVTLYSWTPEKRKLCTDAASFSGFDKVNLSMKASNLDNFIALKHKNNKGKIIVTTGPTSPFFHVVDLNKTLTDASDDRTVSLSSTTNQDGGVVSLSGVQAFFEDPTTGLVWYGSSTGLYTLNPTTFFNNPIVNQIKVSRNDGTELADYLLNNISVSHITQDGQGRKWISTNGAGVVVTSNDGKRIIDEINVENSKLPSDIVNSCTYDPSTGGMIISTARGFAEFIPSGSAGSTVSQELRAYPNPVEPDYYGYVTIDNISENSLVKIVDASGAIVRDLGIVDNGSVQWDVMGMDFKRVKTGVYYILVSPAYNGDGESQVGKILVMN